MTESTPSIAWVQSREGDVRVGRGGREGLQMDMRNLLGVMDMFIISIVVMVSGCIYMVNLLCSLNIVQYIVC